MLRASVEQARLTAERAGVRLTLRTGAAATGPTRRPGAAADAAASASDDDKPPDAGAAHAAAPPNAVVPFGVQADARRLAQVFGHLLSNAVRYNRPDGAVTVACVAQGAQVRIDVRDTGPGLTAAQLGALFQPFNQLGAEYSKVQGSGLGLVMARQLVEHMGGTLEAASTPEVGSTFTVRLRAAPLAAAPARARPPAGARADRAESPRANTP